MRDNDPQDDYPSEGPKSRLIFDPLLVDAVVAVGASLSAIRPIENPSLLPSTLASAPVSQDARSIFQRHGSMFHGSEAPAAAPIFDAWGAVFKIERNGALQALRLDQFALMYCAVRSASAAVEICGGAPSEVGKTLMSQTNRFGSSCDWQYEFDHGAAAVLAHRAGALRMGRGDRDVALARRRARRSTSSESSGVEARAAALYGTTTVARAAGEEDLGAVPHALGEELLLLRVDGVADLRPAAAVDRRPRRSTGRA